MKPKKASGKRFVSLAKSLASEPGVFNPKALAAYIGRKKLGAKAFAKKARRK